MPAMQRGQYRDPHRARMEGYIATGRQKHGTKAAVAKSKSRSPLIERMSAKLNAPAIRSRYRLRKQTVEPVFDRSNRQGGSGSSCCEASRK